MRPHETRNVPRSVHLNESRYSCIALSRCRMGERVVGLTLRRSRPSPDMVGAWSFAIMENARTFVAFSPVPSSTRPP